MPIIVDPVYGTTTLDDLLAELYARGFDYLNDGGTGAARAKRWINQSYRGLCARADFPFLFADQTGPAPLTLTDVRVVLSVFDATQKRPLVAVSRSSLLATKDDLTFVGTPLFWYRDTQTRLSTWPVNTVNTLNVRYVIRPPLLADGADVTLVPDEWADLIVDGAVLKGKKDDDDYDQYVAQFEADVARMVSAELDDNSSPDHIELTDDRFGGDW